MTGSARRWRVHSSRRVADGRASSSRHQVGRFSQPSKSAEEWPLRANLAGHYPIRTGDYRVQFFLKDQAVIVTRIGHRDGFYDE